MTEGETVGWHHRLNGHELEQTPEEGEGRGSLACCSPCSCKESDMTEQLNNKGTAQSCLGHSGVTHFSRNKPLRKKNTSGKEANRNKKSEP